MCSHDNVFAANLLDCSACWHNDANFWLARDMAINAHNGNVGVDTALGINSCSRAMFSDRIKACGWFNALLCRQAQHLCNSSGVFTVLGQAK